MTELISHPIIAINELLNKIVQKLSTVELMDFCYTNTPIQYWFSIAVSIFCHHTEVCKGTSQKCL